MSLAPIRLRQLADIVGSSNLLTSPEERIAYSYDATAMIARQPDAIAFAETADQIAGIQVRRCSKLLKRGGAASGRSTSNGFGLKTRATTRAPGVALAISRARRINA